MSNTVYNERTKLLATALNGAAVASFAVGVVAPLVAVFSFYSAGCARGPVLWTIVGVLIWLFVAIALHFVARRIIGGLDDAE